MELFFESDFYSVLLVAGCVSAAIFFYSLDLSHRKRYWVVGVLTFVLAAVIFSGSRSQIWKMELKPQTAVLHRPFLELS